MSHWLKYIKCKVFKRGCSKRSMTWKPGINECISTSKDALELARAIERGDEKGIRYNIGQIDQNLAYFKANIDNYIQNGQR